MKHKVQVIGSICLKVTAYGMIVQDVLENMGLKDETVEVVHVEQFIENGEEDLLKRLDLRNRCRLAYCPGCNFQGKELNGERYLPVLVIDGEVLIYSSFPTRDLIEKTIRNKLGYINPHVGRPITLLERNEDNN